MTTDSPGRTARIYKFPVRTAVHSSEQCAKPVTDISSVRYPAAASGSGWYHETAILEAEQATHR